MAEDNDLVGGDNEGPNAPSTPDRPSAPPPLPVTGGGESGNAGIDNID